MSQLNKMVANKCDYEKYLEKAVRVRRKYLSKCSHLLDEINDAEIRALLETEIVWPKESMETKRSNDIFTETSDQIQLWPENDMCQLRKKMENLEKVLDQMNKNNL